MTINKPLIVNEKSSASARAERLKMVRMMTGLSRRVIQEKYSINSATLTGWETPIHGGLSLKGANKIIEMLGQNNILCNIEWLMHGEGVGPQFITAEKGLIAGDDEYQQILRELTLFRQFYKNVTDLTIADDGMEPFYCKGCLVAGKTYYQDFERFINVDCIVTTMDDCIFLRRLKPGRKSGRFNLVCINSYTTVSEPIAYDIELITVSPVIFMRKTEALLLNKTP